MFGDSRRCRRDVGSARPVYPADRSSHSCTSFASGAIVKAGQPHFSQLAKHSAHHLYNAQMGLLGGRSRHTSRRTRSDGDLKIPRRPKEPRTEENVIEVKKPELDELRERRREYYSVPEADRRRASTTASASQLTSRSSSKRHHSISSRPSPSSSDTQSRRKKSSTRSKVHKETSNEGHKDTSDYVYERRQPPEEANIRIRDAERRSETRLESRRSKSASLLRDYSLDAISEVEITPDDSISQVGERSVPEPSKIQTASRPSLRRSNTTSSRLAPISETDAKIPPASVSRRRSKISSSKRDASVRRHSTTSVPTMPQLVDCLTCGADDVPSTSSAKLACGHRMCHDCLKRIFEMSVKDPVHMPPRCCGTEHIPLKHVDKLFDTKFKLSWNRKYQEYHTKNRIYCPTLKCGEWIKPSHIHTSLGRKFAQCPRCRTKVCTLCNNKMHKSTECPKDPEIAKLVEQAKDLGWQRCYSCSAFVEKKEGCNHMTCRCLAEFCILCGLKWKTCECPWFDYSTLPNPERLNEMRVPEPIQFLYNRVFGGLADLVEPIPPPPMGAAAPAAAAAAAPADRTRRRPPRDVNYRQEMDQRRTQERLDADLARRLQLATLMEPVRNHPAGRLLDNEFVQDVAHIAMDVFAGNNFVRQNEREPGRRRSRARFVPAAQGADAGPAARPLNDDI